MLEFIVLRKQRNFSIDTENNRSETFYEDFTNTHSVNSSEEREEILMYFESKKLIITDIYR